MLLIMMTTRVIIGRGAGLIAVKWHYDVSDGIVACCLQYTIGSNCTVYSVYSLYSEYAHYPICNMQNSKWKMVQNAKWFKILCCGDHCKYIGWILGWYNILLVLSGVLRWGHCPSNKLLMLLPPLLPVSHISCYCNYQHLSTKLFNTETEKNSQEEKLQNTEFVKEKQHI